MTQNSLCTTSECEQQRRTVTLCAVTVFFSREENICPREFSLYRIVYKLQIQKPSCRAESHLNTTNTVHTTTRHFERLILGNITKDPKFKLEFIKFLQLSLQFVEVRLEF
jgi:hypothetical protein